MTNWQHLLQLVQCIGICCNMLSFSFKVDLISLLISALKISLDHKAVLKGPQASIYFLTGLTIVFYSSLYAYMYIHVVICQCMDYLQNSIQWKLLQVNLCYYLNIEEKRKCNIFQIFLFRILISKSYTKIRESMVQFIKVVIEIKVKRFLS